MIEALAEFEAVMKASHDGLYATDPKTYGLAKGLYRLAIELQDRLNKIEEYGRINAGRLDRLQNDILDLKQKQR